MEEDDPALQLLATIESEKTILRRIKVLYDGLGSVSDRLATNRSSICDVFPAFKESFQLVVDSPVFSAEDVAFLKKRWEIFIRDHFFSHDAKVAAVWVHPDVHLIKLMDFPSPFYSKSADGGDTWTEDEVDLSEKALNFIVKYVCMCVIAESHRRQLRRCFV